jgi:hypothetical protein
VHGHVKACSTQPRGLCGAQPCEGVQHTDTQGGRRTARQGVQCTATRKAGSAQPPRGARCTAKQRRTANSHAEVVGAQPRRLCSTQPRGGGQCTATQRRAVHNHTEGTVHSHTEACTAQRHTCTAAHARRCPTRERHVQSTPPTGKTCASAKSATKHSLTRGNREARKIHGADVWDTSNMCGALVTRARRVIHVNDV